MKIHRKKNLTNSSLLIFKYISPQKSLKGGPAFNGYPFLNGKDLNYLLLGKILEKFFQKFQKGFIIPHFPFFKNFVWIYTEKVRILKLHLTLYQMETYQENLLYYWSCYICWVKGNQKTMKTVSFQKYPFLNHRLIITFQLFYLRFEYIAVVDSDEVIMPTKHDNWADMMTQALNQSTEKNSQERSCWYFRHVYFLDDMLDVDGQGYFPDIPEHMHMMQHVYRSELYNKKGDFIKAFHNPERSLTLHNHFPTACLPNGCGNYEVEPTVGHLQHYRTECTPDIRSLCPKYRNNTVKDTNIWKWKERVVSRTQDTLTKLGFFSWYCDVLVR